MRHITHQADLCVVGGGLSGMCAAVAAARHGAKVVLMQDRPVLGGNASSEVRMWICGAQGPNKRETGIVEELIFENLYRNPGGNWMPPASELPGQAYQVRHDGVSLYYCRVNNMSPALPVNGERILAKRRGHGA